MSFKATKKRLKRKIASLFKRIESAGQDFTKYADDPVGFCRDILKVELTYQQIPIAEAVASGQRVMVESAHSVGKTFLAACLVLWWYFTRNPGVTVTTAPTKRDVEDLLWTEIRLLCNRANLPRTFIGPSAPEMKTSPEHYAKGFTASTGESFQGRHRASMFFVFDEAEGVHARYWMTLRTMYMPNAGHACLAILNPTTTSSQAYLESQATFPDGTPIWARFTISALDHPNVIAELNGQPSPIPHAVSLAQVEDWIASWCLPISESDKTPTDFEWHPGSGNWWRPGPLAEPRLLGRRPSSGTNSVWSDYLFGIAERAVIEIPLRLLPEIGCDCAHFGDDFTAIHVRCGPVSLHHESVNGWDSPKIESRLRELCTHWANWHNDRVREHSHGERQLLAREVKVKIDGDAFGSAGPVDHKDGWNWIAVSAASAAKDKFGYPNKRSELWFDTAYRAKIGQLSFARLSQQDRGKLRIQSTMPTYRLDGAGRRVVDEKHVMKKELGRSPDDMDAVNLAYYEAPELEAPTGFRPDKPRDNKPQKHSNAARRGLWGKRE